MTDQSRQYLHKKRVQNFDKIDYHIYLVLNKPILKNNMTKLL